MRYIEPWTHCYCQNCGVIKPIWSDLGRSKKRADGVFVSDENGNWMAADLLCKKCRLVLNTFYWKTMESNPLETEKKV